MVHELATIDDAREGTTRQQYEVTIKTAPKPDEFEMYNVSADPLELDNLAGSRRWKEREAQLRQSLDEQLASKRLTLRSGPVPGERRS